MNFDKTILEVSMKYKDMKLNFTGRPEDVVRSILGFIRKVIPEYEIIEGMTITIDIEDLLKKMKGLIAFTPNRIVLTIPREKIGGEKEMILIHLIISYIGYTTGRLEKNFLTTSELISLTGGKAGTVGARLSELTSLGWVERIGRGEYKISTLGVKCFLDKTLPKVNKGGIDSS